MTRTWTPRATRLLMGASAIAILAAVASCAPAKEGALTEEDRAAMADRGSRGKNEGTHTSASTGGAPVQGVATFTAADVARLALVIEQTAASQARVALDRAVTAEVKTYARRMIDERTASAERLATLVDRAKPRFSDPTPLFFERDAQRTRDILVEVARSDFDLTFMTAEVAIHATLLGLLDASLLPSVSHAAATAGSDGVAREVEQELRVLRAATADHVAHALRVQGVVRAALAGADEGATARGDDLGTSAASEPEISR